MDFTWKGENGTLEDYKGQEIQISHSLYHVDISISFLGKSGAHTAEIARTNSAG